MRNASVALTLAVFLPATTVAAAAPPTVAAVPFAAEGMEPWLGEALADAISLRAYRQPSVNTSTVRQVNAALRQLELDPKAVFEPAVAARLGRQLGAHWVVVGRYAAEGDNIAVTLRVIEVEHAKVRGWERIVKPKASLLDLETRVARCVARVLGAKNPKPEPGAFGTSSVPAWRSLTIAFQTLGRQSLSPRAADPNAPPALTPAELTRARKDVEAAIAADDSYGRAWAARALAQAMAGGLDDAWATLGEATAHGGGDDPYTTLIAAFIRMRQGERAEAEKILQSAIARHPGFLHARGTLGQLYQHVGRFREARATFRTYAEVAPRNPWVRAQIGYAHARLRKHDEAIAETQAALAILPDSPHLMTELAGRYIDASRWGPATELLEKVVEASPDNIKARVRLGYVYLRQGDAAKAVASTQRVIFLADPVRHRRELAYGHLNLARAHGHLGQLDPAFENLTQAVEAGLASLREVEQDERLATLRKDKRWRALLDASDL